MTGATDSNVANKPIGYIFLVGFMGSGKSHWGKIWAAAHNIDFVDLDEAVEKTAGTTVASMFENMGEDYFRMLEAKKLRNLPPNKSCIVACGGGTPCFFDNMQWMNEHGITIFLSATSQEILSRVLEEKEKRPLIKKLNESELLFFIEQKLKERDGFYTQANHTLATADLNDQSIEPIISTIHS